MQPNRGIPLNLDWVADVHVNTSAVERRAATLVTRRTVKKEWQAAWLLRAVTLLDLTTLAGDDTPGNVRRLCAKARQPVRAVLGAVGQRGCRRRRAEDCSPYLSVHGNCERSSRLNSSGLGQ